MNDFFVALNASLDRAQSRYDRQMPPERDIESEILAEERYLVSMLQSDPQVAKDIGGYMDLLDAELCGKLFQLACANKGNELCELIRIAGMKAVSDLAERNVRD
jgi:hypothetical protein